MTTALTLTIWFLSLYTQIRIHQTGLRNSGGNRTEGAAYPPFANHPDPRAHPHRWRNSRQHDR